MSTVTIERGLSPEDQAVLYRRYGSFAKWALGISPLNTDWQTIDRLTEESEIARQLAEASEIALRSLLPHVATMLKLKFGLEKPGSIPLSEAELGRVYSVSSSTMSRRLGKAVVSLDYGGRLEPVKDLVRSRRPQ